METESVIYLKFWEVKKKTQNKTNKKPQTKTAVYGKEAC